MAWITRSIVFLIIVFLYIHIYHHLKTSSDLEVFELEQPTKNQLEEVCDIRQPVKFRYDDPTFLEYTELPNVEEHYGVFDIKIRNVEDKLDNTSPFMKTQDLPLERETYIPFLLTKAIPLFQKDDTKRYFSENNQSFLRETGIHKKYKYYDSFLRPPMISSSSYDYWIGTNKTSTPLRYSLNYRSYYLVTHGEIEVMLIPPSYKRYMSEQVNYDLLEFKSPIHPWNVQSQYKNEFEKIKTLTLTLKQGDIIYIPSYWWYSIQFNNLSSVAVFNYRTYMNTITIMPHLAMYALQNTNIKHQIAKIENSVKVISGNSERRPNSNQSE